jgi:hypothetical protein
MNVPLCVGLVELARRSVEFLIILWRVLIALFFEVLEESATLAFAHPSLDAQVLPVANRSSEAWETLVTGAAECLGEQLSFITSVLTPTVDIWAVEEMTEACAGEYWFVRVLPPHP